MFSHAPARIARISASLLSGKAARRFARPIRCAAGAGRAGADGAPDGARPVGPERARQREHAADDADHADLADLPQRAPETRRVVNYAGSPARTGTGRDGKGSQGGGREGFITAKLETLAPQGKQSASPLPRSGRRRRVARPLQAVFRSILIRLGSRPSRTMCGLYASIAFAPERARIDRVAHRGPDGSGWREFASAAGPVALGHRRLAIIDLQRGRAAADGRRRRPLPSRLQRRDLQLPRAARRAAGARAPVPLGLATARSCSRAYREWGEDCLDRFNGMFAFAIWDEREQRLFAGARPLRHQAALLLADEQRGFAFASEIKQLLGTRPA